MPGSTTSFLADSCVIGGRSAASAMPRTAAIDAALLGAAVKVAQVSCAIDRQGSAISAGSWPQYWRQVFCKQAILSPDMCSGALLFAILILLTVLLVWRTRLCAEPFGPPPGRAPAPRADTTPPVSQPATSVSAMLRYVERSA